MKLFFYVGYFRTGGPESIHQYCDMANLLGYDACIYYHDTPSDAPLLYREKYCNLKRATKIEDDANNVLFVPECVSIANLRRSWPHIRMVCMWLSFDYGTNLLEQHVNDPSIIHVFQSAYARDCVCGDTGSNLVTFDLHDYVSEKCILSEWDRTQKENVVAYFPNKDHLTDILCHNYHITCVPIRDMSYEQVVATLQRCKVYVDLGGHPGRDRIPREAAALGCVVITNRSGAAQYYEDVPICQKCDTVADVVFQIHAVFKDYDAMLQSQDNYRSMIYGQKRELARQMRRLCSYLYSSSSSMKMLLV